MSFSKKGMISNIAINDEAFSQMRLELKKGETGSFQQLIVAASHPILSDQLLKNYPQLLEDSEDILTDVFSRLKKQICKVDFDQSAFNINENLSFLFTAECRLAIPNPETTEKNLNLSRQEFKEMLARLRGGDETLIEKIYLSHLKKCIKYLVYQCQSTFDDAYQCSMEALLSIRKDLINGKIFYGNLNFYFTRRARNIWYKLKIKDNRLKADTPIEEVDIEEEEYIESNILEAELNEHVDQAINKLGAECRNIIRMYYYEELSLKEIAEILNKTHAAVRKQVTRCRDKLRTHLGEHFFERFSSSLKE